MKTTGIKAITVATLAGGLLALAPSEARADDSPTEIELGRPMAGVNRLKNMWRYEIGYRGAFPSSSGYDPFSTRQYFDQLSMSASRTVFASGRFSFAPGIGWDYGQAGATARGDSTSLTVNRLVVTLEGRMHFSRWGYAFVRGAPGVVSQSAQISDPTSPAPLEKSSWLAAADVSAGYAFPFWSPGDDTLLAARFWLQADGGYGWVDAQRLNLTPSLGSGDPQRTAGVDLGSLALRGPFFRLSLAASL